MHKKSLFLTVVAAIVTILAFANRGYAQTNRLAPTAASLTPSAARASVVGQVAIVHEDHWDKEWSADTAVLVDQTGIMRPLSGPPVLIKRLRGATVEVRDVPASQSGLLIDAERVKIVQQPQRQKKTSRPTLLVIPVEESVSDLGTNAPAHTVLTPQQVNDIMQVGPDSVKAFYERNSDHAVKLAIDIFPQTITVPNYGIGLIGERSIVENTDQFIDFSSYSYYLFVLMNDDCFGRALVDPILTKTNDGDIALSVAVVSSHCLVDKRESDNEKAFHHEVGHLLGLRHVGSWREKVIPLSVTADDVEQFMIAYGDDSVMGNGVHDLAPTQRQLLGAHFGVAEAIKNGMYRIQALQRPAPPAVFDPRPAPAMEILPAPIPPRIPPIYEVRIPASNGYYSLEYRGAPFFGIVLRFAPNNSWINFLYEDAYRPDIASDAIRLGGRADYLWRKGQRFHDPIRNIAITVTQTGIEQVAVKVEF